MRGAVIDLFAGGGGASTGLESAGYAVDAACNHDPDAITMHRANHPQTLHLQQSVWDVDPPALLRRLRRRWVDVLWASPDCTHFSRAKGGKPRSGKIRMLAHVLVEWAHRVRPRCIMMENVPEFTSWGPLDEHGQPIKERAGESFGSFVAGLRLAGYQVDWRVLCAADYGAPTTRRRFFLVARLDAAPVWPAPTHADPRRPCAGLAPWRTAAECIDWSVPMLSIFADRDEARRWAREHGQGVPQRPLAEATMRRIAEGVVRFVVQRPPFIVPSGAVFGVQTGYGERPGQAPRVVDLDRVVAAGCKVAVCAAFLTRYYGGPRAVVGAELDQPLPTVTGVDHHGLVVAHLEKFYGTARGASLDAPVDTVTSQGQKFGLVAALLVKYYGQGGQWSGLDEPMHTVVAKARMGVVTVVVDGETYAIEDILLRMLTPRELATANGFPEGYVLTGTKEQQIRRIGNSVPPQLVQALARANR